MPSPIGHIFAGVAVAWSLPAGTRPDRQPPRADWKLATLCAALAALPDIDLVYMPLHRRMTHSIPMALIVTIVAVAVTGWVSRRAGHRRSPVSSWTGLACGLAWSSHVLLDWLGADASVPYGIQMLWPFSDEWFYSGWDLFPGTERRQPLSARAMWINLRAAVQETVMMGTVALAVWFASHRAGKPGRGGKPGRAGEPGRGGG
jgi:membrane-bound metal-dependent hydrolase YbcI (DUF457 family)